MLEDNVSKPSDGSMDPILQNTSTSVTDEMNKRLLAPFERTEIERALKQMHPTKTPGPDWRIVGNTTVANCLDILNRRRSIKEWNSTLIALIQKTKAPRVVSEYRPISL